MKGAVYSNIGGRDNNEDIFLAEKSDRRFLFAVADGLGGIEAGEVASGIVKKVFSELFHDSPAQFDLTAAICKANDEIVSTQESTGKKMKTTVAAVYIDGNVITCGHVGDSRIYLFSQTGRIAYQSVDHSVSQLSVFTGDITPREIRGHEDRNILTKALGNDGPCDPSVAAFATENMYAALLCTDGFWEYVYEEEMETLLLHSKGDVRSWLSAMKQVLRERAPADSDNNTAVAVIF